jgi:N-acetylmuramoyl-L-alanine amidase
MVGSSHARLLCALIGALLPLACQSPTAPTPHDAAAAAEPKPAVQPPPVWPEPGGKLSPPILAFPASFKARRIYLDPGHAASATSHGNTSCFCLREEEFNLQVADALAQALTATGHFEVKIGRAPGKLVPYPARLEEATRWKADAFLSIHSDARGEYAWGYWKTDELYCARNLTDPGFAVLWSDLGTEKLIAQRLRLARAISAAMIAAGFPPYPGQNYEGLYEGDPEQPAVFVDRHVPAQRVFFLHRPRMPSVVIETHHALDPREATRWQEPETLAAFNQAVAAALIGFFAGR